MERRSDYPNTKAWETLPRANILSPNKSPTHHIQSPRKAFLKKNPPNSEKNELIPNFQFGLKERQAFLDRTITVLTFRIL
jgi:hypothetical protein